MISPEAESESKPCPQLRGQFWVGMRMQWRRKCSGGSHHTVFRAKKKQKKTERYYNTRNRTYISLYIIVDENLSF